MLKSLKIKNFQSHKNTELQFHSGINVIHGRNTSGKSAIIRALLLASTNRPSGFRYHSNFSKGQTEVKIDVPEATILFKKDKKQAMYVVDGEEFTGFGMSVPDVVTKTLNLSDLNISKQLDPHFLIIASPGEVAKTLNKITRIDEVDQWISKLTSKINSNNKEVSLLTGQCKDIKEKLTAYKIIGNADRSLSEIETLADVITSTKTKLDTLKSICTEMDNIELQLINGEYIELCDYELLELEALVNEKGTMIETLAILDDFISLSSYIESYKIVENVDVDLNRLVEAVDQIQVARKEVTLVKGVLRDISKIAEDIKTASLIYKRRKKDYSDLLVSLKKCPLCLSEINSDTIEFIIKDM